MVGPRADADVPVGDENKRAIGRRAAMQPDGWSDGPRAVYADRSAVFDSLTVSLLPGNTLGASCVRAGTWDATRRLPYGNLLQAGEGRLRGQVFRYATSPQRDLLIMTPPFKVCLP